MSVATPLLLVTAVPTEVPSSVKVTVSPAIARPVTEELSVAVSVAVPPKAAVPATLRERGAGLADDEVAGGVGGGGVVGVAREAGDDGAGVGADPVGRGHAGERGHAVAVGHGRADGGAIEREADGLARRSPGSVTEELSVAVKVAVPPNVAVPETLRERGRGLADDEVAGGVGGGE